MCFGVWMFMLMLSLLAREYLPAYSRLAVCNLCCRQPEANYAHYSTARVNRPRLSCQTDLAPFWLLGVVYMLLEQAWDLSITRSFGGELYVSDLVLQLISLSPLSLYVMVLQ